MKKKLLLLLGLCLVMTWASSALAAVTLKRMGDHPFCRPPLASEADLRALVESKSADLQAGFVKAGSADLYPEFVAQFPTATIETISVAPGTEIEWMLFRKKGNGPVTAVKDVTWGGEEAFDAFSFHIDKDGQRYRVHRPHCLRQHEPAGCSAGSGSGQPGSGLQHDPVRRRDSNAVRWSLLMPPVLPMPTAPFPR